MSLFNREPRRAAIFTMGDLERMVALVHELDPAAYVNGEMQATILKCKAAIAADSNYVRIID